MKKILIIMIMICSAAFADDHSFVVENSTMVDVYYNIFNAMSAMFKNDEYLDLLRLAFALGGFFVFATGVLQAFDGNGNAKILSPYGKYILGGFVLISLLFSSFKSTLWVTTNEIPSYCSTSSANVGFAVELPSVLAYSFSTINLIGRKMTEMAETAFTKPSATGTTSMSDSGGFLGSLKNTIKLQSFNPNSVTLQGTTSDSVDFVALWQKHFNKCVYEVANNKGAEGAKKIAEMKSSKDLNKWTKDFLDFKFANSTKATGDTLMTINGVSLSCRNNYQFLVDANQKLADENECYFKDMNAGVLQLITGNPGLAGSNFDEIAIQSGIIYALESSANMGSIGIQSGTTYASGKTKAEFIQSSLGQGSYMAEMLPYMQMTMRAILYGFFPFVFVIVLLPGGLKVLVQYGQTMLWIELWGPTAAVINMFLNLQAENEMSDVYNAQGVTMMSSMNMLSEASTIAGIGAYLYMSVPALTWLILKGSGHMLGNMTSGMSANLSSNLKSASVAKDMSMNEASKASGTSITDTINSIEGSNMANQVSNANGFSKVGMQKTIDTKTATDTAKRLSEIETVTSQGGNESYIETQKKKAGYDATAEKTDTDVKTAEGGKQVVSDNQFVKTSTELETTKKEINSAGGKKAVVSNKSDMNNKSFNKDLEVNKNTDVNDYKNLGKKESADTNATSDVVSKKGTQGLYDSKVQSMLTEIDTAKGKKTVAGSNENVAKTDSSMNTKEFSKKEVIDDTTNINDYKNTGRKESADLNATSDVVSKKGTEGFYASKKQALTAESDTSLEKRKVAGSDAKASKVDTDKNVAGFKTDKKTFDKYSTDTVSTSDFEKRKEDITKTLETKNSIESSGQSTENFYGNEAKQSAEDRKANVAKADLNNDNNLDSKEVSEYAKDVTTKSVSDQNALKSKNERLLENADKFANSENKDVRDTYNKAYAKYASQGDEVAKIAGARAVQESVATKEQQLTVDEKSEYVDRMAENEVSGADKAKVQVQKDVESISKTESETKSYGNFIKEKMEGTESYKNVEENYFNKFKEEGMSDNDARISAKNATLSAHSNNGFKNSDYSKDVLDHNLSNIQNNMNSKLEQKALEKGVLSKDDFNLVKREDALEKQITGLESQRKSGALSPSLAMTLHSANRKLSNTKEELSDVRNNLQNFAKTDKDGQAIVEDANNKSANVISNMENMGVMKVDESGMKFADSVSKLDTNNLSEKDKGNLRTMKGNLEGNKIETVGADGREYKVVTDISSNKVTNYSKAQMGYENISADTYDKGYAFHDATSGKYMKETAIASSVVDNVKNIAQYAGGAKVVLGK